MKPSVGALKLLSVLVVWCMICSSFIGIIFLIPGAGQAQSPSLESDGDMFIGEEFENNTWTINGGKVNLDGNLTIRSGGIVTVTNAELNFLSSQGVWNGHPFSRVHNIIIEDGGQLIMQNSALKAEDVLYNATFALGVLVRNGGILIAEGSQLNFNGKILVDEASFIAYDSVITGPLFTAVSSTVELYDSVMDSIPGTPTSDEVAYPYSFATSSALSLDVDYVFQRNPDTARTIVPGGQDAENLTMDDVYNVTVANGEGIEISGFDIGGLFFNEGEALSVTLNALYMTTDDFVSTADTFYYSEYLGTPTQALNMEVIPTYEAYSPNTTNQYRVLSEDLTTLDLSSTDLSVLSVTFDNTAAKDVYIDRVWIEVELSMPAYHNITVAGNGEFTAVNTELGVNYQNYTNSAYRKLVVRDAAQANLYGVDVNGIYMSTGMGPFITLEKEIEFKPLARDSTDTTTEINVLGLINDDGLYTISDYYYEIDGGQVMDVTLNTGGLEGSITNLELLIKWRTDLNYPVSDNVQYYLATESPINSSILISVADPSEATSSYQIPDNSIISISEIPNLHIKYGNNNIPGRSAFIGYLVLYGVVSPSINVYRWAEVGVVDQNNLPVSGAEVIAKRSDTGQPAVYYYNYTENMMPPQGVLDYLGQNESTFGVTNDLGMVTIPLLTDIIDPESYSNSHPVPGYAITATYEDLAAINYTTSLDSSFDAYPNLQVQSIEMLLVLEDLELALPDLVVSSITTDPAVIYSGDLATIYINVTNIGLNTAGEFVVNVVDRIGNVANHLGNYTVSGLVASGSTAIAVPWISNHTAPGTHVISTTVDYYGRVMESNEANVFYQSVEVRPLLPDLEVDGTSVTFSQNPGVAKQPLTIIVNVSNIGRLEAASASVRYYLGNPSSGGQYIGESLISVPAGVTAATSFEWVPIQIGLYPIYVMVNEARSIVEYGYDNNMASGNLVVILVAEDSDWLVNETDYWDIQASTMEIPGNIIVEDQGYLSFTGTHLFMRQYADNKPTQIVVRDSGTLVLNRSTVSSNLVLRIYLFNDSSLFLYSSTLSSNVILIMDDSSHVHMEESSINGDLQAPATSSASLVAYNTTFGRVWSYFGGSSVAELTGATISGIPPVSPKDSAVVTLYSWIHASVYDGTGMHKIPGVHVETRSFFTKTLYAVGETDEAGVWTFRAVSDVITATSRGINLGYYELNATYWYDGERYDSDLSMQAEVLYSPDAQLVRRDAEVRLDISSALPDIDPPFEVSNLDPLRGEDITLSTVINNAGVVTAYDIKIRFEDNNSAGKVIISDYVIEELAAASNMTVSVIWKTTYPLGEHNLSVMVDPEEEIPELNEDNNFNYTVVNVLGVPDLVITSNDIIINPTSPIRDKAASITVSVRNIGDNAIAAFNVSFYDEAALIGRTEISNLPSGQIGTASITWTPTIPGLRNVTVVLDEESSITESNEANNQAEIVVQVCNYPDLSASSVSFLVNGAAASMAFVNNQVTITATIYNIGESTAEQFDVVFWLNDEQVLQIVRISTLASGSVTTASAFWVAEIVPGEGLYQNNTLTAVINPASNSTIVHIPEMDDPVNANNEASQVLQVIDNRPDMAVTNGRIQSVGVDVTSATIGENVHVLFYLENVGIIDATNVDVEVRLVNETIDMLLYSQTRNLGAGETTPYNVSWVVNVTSGDYSLLISVDTGSDADQSDNVLDVDLAVTVPSPVISIDLSNKTDYAPGTSIYVRGVVKKSGSDTPLTKQPIKVKITDNSGFPLTDEYTTTTDDNGQFTTWVLVPVGKEGQQVLLVILDTIEGEFSEPTNINIIAPLTPETIPGWVYLLIIAIVIVVIVIFSLYLYRVGLGRMVECGNCGALIPEASKRCPKCGVQFETDTAKCSECGAWIPAKAESCPECGAKFMTEPVETGQGPGYIEAMRKQYDEYIDGFREQAKAALGNKYSEEKFMEWLQTEPNYLPFEEWLRKEEMSRRSGVFPCPVCGTLNPRDSEICNRCGTVFDQQKSVEAPKAEGKKSPFRRIVRKSSETKEKPVEPIEETPAEQPAEEDEKKTE